eukprot:s2252_g12.t1
MKNDVLPSVSLTAVPRFATFHFARQSAEHAVLSMSNFSDVCIRRCWKPSTLAGSGQFCALILLDALRESLPR